MKAEYGDKITIPEGCKAIVKDGCVVFQKEQSFKDGDILVSVEKNVRRNAFIYKSTDDEGFHSYYIGLDCCGQLSLCEKSTNRWGNDELSYATEEEKQQLFDKMKEKGLLWNVEEKKVEKIRWRAKEGERYFYVYNQGNVTVYKDDGYHVDENLYEYGNYFRTREQAEEAARLVKETLDNYHNEIGE